ncbi:DUF3784 domain-containing protein [Mycoplasmatota bacterium WC44]
MIYGIIVVFVGVLLLVGGWLIWIKEKNSLIHSYHQENVKDTKGYSRSMGRLIFFLGVFHFANGVLAFTDIVPEIYLALTLILSFLPFVIALVYVQKKYNGGVF